jgi:membrane-associated phospholipid phosphatase
MSEKALSMIPPRSVNAVLVEDIWRMDENMSKTIFELTLPYLLECILSVPGNVFGMVPCVWIGPLLMMIVLDDSNEDGSPSPSWILTIVTCLLTLGYLVTWVKFLKGDERIKKSVLTTTNLYLAGPFFSTAICYTQTSDPQLFSLSIYPSVLWMLSLMLALMAKNTCLRERPCVKFPHLVEQKHFSVIPKLLAEVGAKGSFPSGDASGVVAFAIPLATRYPILAILMVLLACFGRMYFLAHHLLDTVAGCMISYAVHLSLTQFGTGMEHTLVWHPLVAVTAFVVVLTMFGKLRYR